MQLNCTDECVRARLSDWHRFKANLRSNKGPSWQAAGLWTMEMKCKARRLWFMLRTSYAKAYLCAHTDKERNEHVYGI